MAKEKESLLNQGLQKNKLKQNVTLVENGLEDNILKKMYKKHKNEGKCCEGGAEGWTG